MIIGREFTVTALRSLTYARGVAIPASPLGKIKMVARGCDSRADSRVDGEVALPLWVDRQAALWVVLVTALASAADYFRRFNLFPRNDVVTRDDRVA